MTIIIVITIKPLYSEYYREKRFPLLKNVARNLFIFILQTWEMIPLVVMRLGAFLDYCFMGVASIRIRKTHIII